MRGSCHYRDCEEQVPNQNEGLPDKGEPGPYIRFFHQKILAEYGIHKTYNQEGGRTTRSTRPAAEGLVKRLNELEILGNPELRSEVLDELQSFFVEKVKLYFERERLQLDIAIDTISPALIIRHVLQAAMEKNSAGAVAQHLVGAKLALRFREMEVENHSHTTADVQLGRPGDFLLGDTSFHVTVSPGEALFRKCKENIRDGYRTAVIVPDSKVEAAKQLCEIQGLEEQVSLYPLEHFVAQNLEEMSSFERAAFKSGFRELLETYNRRVRDVETDRSLLIEIPKNL